MSYCPLPLHPVAVPKPWGGGHLDRFRQQQTAPIGEVVIYSNMDIFPVQVRHGETILPVRAMEQQLPFMVKLLSTADPLSLQNHPADEDIEMLGLTGCGKEECWLILDAASDAEIFLGLKEGLDAGVLSRLEEYPEPLSLFESYRPQAGDIYYLPAGLVHGTRGKILLYEIQQPSDHTFRVHDFGRGRELHLGLAARVYRPHKPQILRSNRFLGNKFAFELVHLDGSYPWQHRFDRDEVVTWLGEPGLLLDGDERLPLSFADSFLALQGHSLVLQGRGILVRAFAAQHS